MMKFLRFATVSIASILLFSLEDSPSAIKVM
jgi:hypothetical protein